MKKNDNQVPDEIEPEYDFSEGIRGKYARKLREEGYTIRVYESDGSYAEREVLGEKVVVLDDDVWAYFPTSESVNATLRTLIQLVADRQAKSIES